MSDDNTCGPARSRLEPGASLEPGGPSATISIAISLKRIADALTYSPNTPHKNLHDILGDIAEILDRRDR